MPIKCFSNGPDIRCSHLLVRGNKGIIEESAPLQNTVISLVTGCLSIIDIHLRDESKGKTFNTLNSRRLFPRIDTKKKN